MNKCGIEVRVSGEDCAGPDFAGYLGQPTFSQSNVPHRVVTTKKPGNSGHNPEFFSVMAEFKTYLHTNTH